MRYLTAILLIWAVLATAVAVHTIQENHRLEKEIKELIKEAFSYMKSRDDLLKKNKELLENITELENENKFLKMRIKTLEREKRKLEEEVDSLRCGIYVLKAIIEEFKKVPKGYYSTDFFPDHANTVSELKKFLKYEFYLPHKYEKEVFDCSEIAAYTEWALEDAGFDAYIAVGYYTEEGGVMVGHAWVIVKVGNQRFYVDPTVMRKGDDRTILIPPDKYNIKPSEIYSNIYEAVEHDQSIDQWDWWNVVGFPPR